MSTKISKTSAPKVTGISYLKTVCVIFYLQQGSRLESCKSVNLLHACNVNVSFCCFIQRNRSSITRTRRLTVLTLLFGWHNVLNVVVNVDPDTSWFIDRYHDRAHVGSVVFIYGKSTSDSLMRLPQNLETIQSKEVFSLARSCSNSTMFPPVGASPLRSQTGSCNSLKSGSLNVVCNCFVPERNLLKFID